jgi:hypothetical protein
MREMERRQGNGGSNLSARQEFNKRNSWELVKLVAFFCTILMNLIFFPGCNGGCNFDSTKYNALFLWLYVIPMLGARTYCLKQWNREDGVSERIFLLAVMGGILSATWVIFLMDGY